MFKKMLLFVSLGGSLVYGMNDIQKDLNKLLCDTREIKEGMQTIIAGMESLYEEFDSVKQRLHFLSKSQKNFSRTQNISRPYFVHKIKINKKKNQVASLISKTKKQ